MTLGVHLGRDAPEPTLRTATDTARKAALLDDDEPWAHVALGYALVWSKQPGAAVAELQKALGFNPALQSLIMCLPSHLAIWDVARRPWHMGMRRPC